MQLENSIIPVHKQTENLQRLQENVDKTLSCMDHVISYYHVAKDTDKIIREGWDGVRCSVCWSSLRRTNWSGSGSDPQAGWTSIWLVSQRSRRLWNTFRTTTLTALNSTQWYSITSLCGWEGPHGVGGATQSGRGHAVSVSLMTICSL